MNNGHNQFSLDIPTEILTPQTQQPITDNSAHSIDLNEFIPYFLYKIDEILTDNDNQPLSLQYYVELFFYIYDEIINEFSEWFEHTILWNTTEILNIITPIYLNYIINHPLFNPADSNKDNLSNVICDDPPLNPYLPTFTIDEITTKLIHLYNIPQPPQKTPEWYLFRYNHITASNAYKALGTIASQNSLIYEKCKPLEITIPPPQPPNTDTKIITLNAPMHPFNPNQPNQPRPYNTTSTLHWGHKYEPLSIIIYEIINNTKISTFGCIEHPTHKFLAASPDGINTDINNPLLYGRMLEIKNVVERIIDGEPSTAYYTQMQLQMEVCDLYECDFLETKFVEFKDNNEFYDDLFETLAKTPPPNFTMTTIQKTSIPLFYGAMIQIAETIHDEPYYQYFIYDVNNDTCTSFENKIYNFQITPPKKLINVFYWKLTVYSCSLIKRDPEWFLNNISLFQNIWDIILTERVTGYEHRKPKTRPSTNKSTKYIDYSQSFL